MPKCCPATPRCAVLVPGGGLGHGSMLEQEDHREADNRGQARYRGRFRIDAVEVGKIHSIACGSNFAVSVAPCLTALPRRAQHWAPPSLVFTVCGKLCSTPAKNTPSLQEADTFLHVHSPPVPSLHAPALSLGQSMGDVIAFALLETGTLTRSLFISVIPTGFTLFGQYTLSDPPLSMAFLLVLHSCFLLSIPACPYPHFSFITCMLIPSLRALYITCPS